MQIDAIKEKCARITELYKYNMNTLNNKYTVWYWALIESRKNVLASKKTHSHHIVPRSLGGIDDATNLVNLTPREHFIAHMLLSRMFSGADKARMIFAARQMLSHYRPCSRTYETLILQANAAMSEKWNDTIWADQVIAERIERLKDPAVRKQMSDTMLDVWDRPEYRTKHSKAMQNIQTPELCAAKSANMQAVWDDPVKRNNLLKNRKPHTDDIKQLQSAASTLSNKNSWADPVVRAKRIAGIKAAIAKKEAAEAASLLN